MKPTASRRVLWLALAAGVGAATAQAVSIIDDSGHALTLPRPARRVVALAPHLTELAFAAGGGSTLVGVIRYSDHPEAAQALPRVGDAFALNLERIAQLKPDLVLVWRSGLPARQREQLRALQLPLYDSEIRHVDDIAATLRRLGTLLGTTSTADVAAAALLQRWNQLQTRYSGRKPVRVFYQLWHEPLMTINGEHLIAQAITACGGVNVFAGAALAHPYGELGGSGTGRPAARRRARASTPRRCRHGRWTD